MKILDDAVAVIPCAGQGRGTWSGLEARGGDAMLPIAGKPAIVWTIQALLKLGVRRVAVVVGVKNRWLEEFLTPLFGGRLDLRVVEPDELRGVGYSVVCGASAFESSRPLLVVLGDTIPAFPPGTSWFASDFAVVSSVPDASRWCIAGINDGRIETLEDKQVKEEDGPFKALIGIYFAREGIESMIPVDLPAKVEMSDLLRPLIRRGSLRAHEVDSWLDVGNPDHVYDAHTVLLQSRSFNRLTINRLKGTITKRSTYTSKFLDEINYFQLLPDELKVYFPRVLRSEVHSARMEIELEYFAYPTLAELLLFGGVSVLVWERLFASIRSIFGQFRKHNFGLDAAVGRSMYVDKNLERIQAILDDPPTGLRELLDASELIVNGRPVKGVRPLVEASRNELERLAEGTQLTVFHGDLCFSNILCNPVAGLVKFIDPRGSFGRQGVLGDWRYDIAKLAHSVHGLYDCIVTDLVQVRVSGSAIDLCFPEIDNLQRIQDRFDQVFLQEIPKRDLDLMVGWLFLSMLPLHADEPNRQIALLAQGLMFLDNVIQ